jgi:hypothetical protein
MRRFGDQLLDATMFLLLLRWASGGSRPAWVVACFWSSSLASLFCVWLSLSGTSPLWPAFALAAVAAVLVGSTAPGAGRQSKRLR